VTIDGERRRYVYGRTRQEVQRRLSEARRLVDDGLPLPPQRETVGSFLTAWLEGQRSRVRARSWMRREQLIRLHALPIIGRIPLARLQPQHVEQLLADRRAAGLGDYSLHHLRAVLHRALEQAVRWNLVARNVVHSVDPPRVARREMTVLTPEEVRRLLDAAAGGPIEALLTLAVTTGMRRGELLALRWRDVDLTRRSLRVVGSLQRDATGRLDILEPKTARSRRQVELTGLAVDALQRHRAAQAQRRLLLGEEWNDHDLVFPSTLGLPQDGSHLVDGQFRPLLRRAGLPPIRFHDLRHTAATLMLERGVHPKIVSEMLGHSTIAITLDLYSHVTPTMQRAAANALDELLVH
jgi:integrase